MIARSDPIHRVGFDPRVRQSWSWRNRVSAENRCVLFRGFAPTGRDSIAQGATLGGGMTNIGQPQRGVTPR